MSIKANIENLLVQLKYPVNDTTKSQVENIAKETNEFFIIANNIFNLKDDLAPVNGLVALSNSVNRVKIKSLSSNPLEIEKFEEIVNKWSNKYKVNLEKVQGKNTYYIVGKNS